MTDPPLFNAADFALCARMSQLAYGPMERLDATPPDGWLSIRPIRNNATDTSGFVARRNGLCVAAFTGTRDLRNFITDAEVELVSPPGYAGAKIHKGFNRAWNSIEMEFGIAIATLCKPEDRLLITGHSLGGALAILAASGQFSRNPLVYTFGQPRVGNQAFADSMAWCADRIFRCINGPDIVPRVPWLSGCYRHVGNEMFITVDFGVRWNDSWWQHLPYDMFGFYGAWRKQGALAALEDPWHHIANYVKIADSFGA